TFVAAAAGGALARLAGVPLPWLLGSLFVTALVCLIGAPIQPIRYGRTVGQVVIGSAIGVQFNVTVILGLLTLLHLMAAVAVVSLLGGAARALLLLRLTRLGQT